MKYTIFGFIIGTIIAIAVLAIATIDARAISPIPAPLAASEARRLADDSLDKMRKEERQHLLDKIGLAAMEGMYLLRVDGDCKYYEFLNKLKYHLIGERGNGSAVCTISW